jgi:glycosyltransferase involved in cell wall biosynthesis
MEKEKAKKKIIRITTAAMSLDKLLNGQLRMLNDRYEVIGVASPGPEIDLVKKREEIRVIPLSMQRHISPIQDLKSLFELIRLIRREKPWMVHSITPKAGLLSMIAAMVCRVPVRVHTFTGLVWPSRHGIMRRILMFTDWITCVCATDIIPEGQGVRRDMMRGKITHKKLRVIGFGNVNGVDLNYFQPASDEKETCSPHRTFTFLYVGRIVGDKGINELVTAFCRIYEKQNNVRLLLVGSYEENLDPVSRTTQQTIEQHPAIECTGMQDDVRPYYAQSDVFVLPSYREGFPNVLLEAGAMSLPCIGTDINGSREIIINGLNGIIIPPHNGEALFQAMWHVLCHPEKVAQMKHVSRKLIATRFGRHYVWQKLLERYRSYE